MLKNRISKQMCLFVVTYAGLVCIGIFIFLLLDSFGKAHDDTLDRIKKTGKLRMITDNNVTSYYIYREKPTGFEYDLAKAFAGFLDAELKIVTPGWNSLFSQLEKGEGDFIAAGMTVTDKREKKVDFSEPYMTIQQKLIHHKLVHNLKSVKDLSGRSVHVRRGTSYHERLEEIRQDGVDVDIVLHDNIPTEELIKMVAEREITFTIADSNIALLNRRYYPDVRIGIAIEENQELAWAAREGDERFLKRMNRFFEFAEKNGILGNIYKKYYEKAEVFDYFDLKKFHQRIQTRLPRYKKIIVRESEKFGFDWRMIAAVVYQESHYNPKAKSHTGVRGLMQVTRTTAREMGIKNRLDPEKSLQAGIRYLNKMYERFDEIEDPHQRLLFALASYNIGYGHIRDAQKIARQKQMDKNRWDDLKKILPLLSKRSYYKKTRYGYARGWEPVQYIDRILTYYDILKQADV